MSAGKLAPELALPTGDDSAQPPTTSAASRERMPAWAAKGTYAPTLETSVAEAIVRDVKRGTTALPATGLLACTVTVTGQVRAGMSGLIGIGSTPTLRVALEIGQEQVRVEAPLPSQDFSFSVPLVTLDRATPLVLTIDLMALGTSRKTIRIPIAPNPQGIVEGSREENTAVCVLVPTVEVEKRMKAELGPVTTILGEVALDAHLVHEESRSFGRADLEKAVAARTSQLAALVGWADPRVTRRKEWAERMLVHHGKRVLEVLAAKKPDETIPGFGQFAGAQITSPCSKEELATAFVDTSDIHRPKEGCAFRASLTRDAESIDVASNTFFHHLTPSLEGDIVLADGNVLVSTITALEGKLKSSPDVMSTVTLPKGDAGAVHFLVPGGLEGKAAPFMLVLRAEKKWIAIPYNAEKKPAPKAH